MHEELIAREIGDSREAAVPLVKRPVYEVRLEAFQGPLDLLLHLTREHEIDIYDIPIAQITEQYLEHLGFMESRDLALAGEVLEMAATLIRVKVQMLLPQQTDEGEEEEDPRQQLVRKLVEYRRFKEVAERLSTWEEDRRQHTPRGVDPAELRDPDEEAVETEEFLRDVTLFDLVDGLREVFSRVPKRIDVHRVDLERVTVEEQMERIRSTLREAGSVSFVSLFEGSSSRLEVVTTCIAMFRRVSTLLSSLLMSSSRV